MIIYMPIGQFGLKNNRAQIFVDIQFKGIITTAVNIFFIFFLKLVICISQTISTMVL